METAIALMRLAVALNEGFYCGLYRRLTEGGQNKSFRQRTRDIDRTDESVYSGCSASLNITNFWPPEWPNQSESPITISRSEAKDCPVSKAGFFRYFKLCRFSQPTHHRALYRGVATDNVRRIVEIGVGNGERTSHLIASILRQHDASDVRYAGIDLFEAGGDASIPLKEFHAKLKPFKINLRVVPGVAATALQRTANDLRGTDWVIISGDQPTESIDAAWHFLPRMLHQKSKVWMETPERNRFDVLTARDVSEQLALRVKKRRRAA